MNEPPVDTSKPQLDFEWDPLKAASNLAKHQVSFEEAATVFNDPLARTVYDQAHSQFEERWFTLGHSDQARLLAVSHTYTATGPNSVRIRIISARLATRTERQHYEQAPH